MVMISRAPVAKVLPASQPAMFNTPLTAARRSSLLRLIKRPAKL
jgi:hypothetical protein